MKNTNDQKLRDLAEREIYARLLSRAELTEMPTLVDLVVERVRETADEQWNDYDVAFAVTSIITDALDMLGERTRKERRLRGREP
jgi:hypothetical protein